LEPFDALFLCAEVTIAILGFSGIVVVFGRISPESDGPSNFHTLFRGTLTPLGIIAIASILDAAALERGQIWRICSAIHSVALCVILIFAQSAIRRGGSLARGMRLPLVGGIATLGLSIWNALSHHSFWPVLTVVWWGIAVSLFAFVALIFSKDAAQEDAVADSA
jgi:hypothetical protein